jgi:hypothetical protein
MMSNSLKTLIFFVTVDVCLLVMVIGCTPTY